MTLKKEIEAIERLGDILNEQDELAKNIMNEIERKFGKHQLWVAIRDLSENHLWENIQYNYLRETFNENEGVGIEI